MTLLNFDKLILFENIQVFRFVITAVILLGMEGGGDLSGSPEFYPKAINMYTYFFTDEVFNP